MSEELSGQELQNHRHANFCAALKAFEVTEGYYEDSVEEDIRPYLVTFPEQRKPLSRYVAITWCSIQDETRYYFYPCYDSVSDAMERAEQFQNDDMCQEFAKSILDLDTGKYLNAAVATNWSGWQDGG